MNVLFKTANEAPTIQQLDKLVIGFYAAGIFQRPYDKGEETMRRALVTHGWHSPGDPYLVVNLDMMALTPTPEGHDSIYAPRDPKQPLTLFELSCLPEGTRVIFVEPFDIFPTAMIPAGTICTIKENGLNEIWSAMLLLPDDEALRASLKEWDGCIHIPGGEPGGDETDASWVARSALALV